MVGSSRTNTSLRWLTRNIRRPCSKLQIRQLRCFTCVADLTCSIVRLYPLWGAGIQRHSKVIQNAESFASAFASAGLSIASGLALGIEQRPIIGALAAKGDTVAFVGTGIDRIYPARNRDLALEIGAKGCIVSEFPLGSPVMAANFPRRNRLISGVSRGVLVVEAAIESGSLITARLAAEQGREVFAIPGSIHSPQARGCHKLIKQGAKLIETAEDVLEELRWSSPLSTSPSSGMSSNESNELLSLIGLILVLLMS